MYQGSYGGHNDVFIMRGYGDDSTSHSNDVALLGSQISHDDVEERNGLLCTSINRTIADTLANEAIANMRGIMEALSKCYHTHGDSFDGIFVPPEYRERFAKLADHAINYYAQNILPKERFGDSEH